MNENDGYSEEDGLDEEATAQLAGSPFAPVETADTSETSKVGDFVVFLFKLLFIVGATFLAFGKFIVAGLKVVVPTLKGWSLVLPKLVPFVSGLAKGSVVFFSGATDDVLRGAAYLLDFLPTFLSRLNGVSQSGKLAQHGAPTAAEAVSVAQETVSNTITQFYFLLTIAFICALVLIAISAIPILGRLLFRRKTSVFISFSHSRELKSVKLSDSLFFSGFRVNRVPFNPSASHQTVVRQTQKALRKSRVVVCLPGDDTSFVDTEVAAATGQGKPIAFCLEEGGHLPNTADKRYPIFNLSKLEGAGFRPMAQFLHYIGGDLRSTWRQIGVALAHPFVWVSFWRMIKLVIALVGCLFLIALFEVLSRDSDLMVVFQSVTLLELLSGAGLFVLISGAMICIIGYLSLVCASLWKQWRVQKQARLKLGEAEFDRELWVDLVPGLKKGSAMYETMFPNAPQAHHERVSATA